MIVDYSIILYEKKSVTTFCNHGIIPANDQAGWTNRIRTVTNLAAGSSYALPEGFMGTLWATSFCNIHDLWLTEFKG